MVGNLLYKREKYEKEIKRRKVKKDEGIQHVEEFCKDMDNIKLLYDTSLTLIYKSNSVFNHDLREIQEFKNLEEWIRKDHSIDMILTDCMDDSEIGIGTIKVVLFNTRNFEDKEITRNEFKKDRDTFKLYQEIESRMLPQALIKDRHGLLVYISSIEIQEQYRNKGYGEYTLKYIDKIIESLFNVEVASLVINADPFRDYYEGRRQCRNKDRLLDRLGYKESYIYYYKFLMFGITEPPKEEFSTVEKSMIFRRGKYMYGDLEYKNKIKDELKELIKESQEQRIEECESYIEQIDSIIKDIKSIDKSKFEIKEKDKVEVIIVKKYIELQSKKAVTEYINESGRRVKTDSHKGERKYLEDDIRAVLKGDKVVGDKQVYEVAYKIALLNSDVFYDNYCRRK